MKKVIYTKYSVERSDNFKIVTSIVKNENGSMQVEKKAAHYKAQSHVESLSEKYKDLKEYYQDSVIEPVFCEMADGQAIFPYIEGENLESKLDKYVDEKDYKGILSEIENYKKMITDNVEIVPFHICDEFIGVFGANYPEEGINAFKVSDIDLIFSNIIISRDKWKVIDYEWTFNFAVPVEFIVYRAIKFYAEINAKRKFLTDNNIYSFLGISEKERELYNKMDDAFQSYVYGQHMPTWRLYESISGKNAYLQDIISKNIDEECMNEIQVFYDYGEGYSEDNSYRIFNDSDTKNEVVINVEKGVTGIRVDPGIDYCVVKIYEAAGNDGGLYNLDISSNGVDLEDNCIVFLTKDPQIYIQNVKEDTNSIYIKYEVQILQQNFVYSMGKSIKGYQDTIKKIEAERQEVDRRQSGTIKHLRERLQNFENELEQIRNEKVKLDLELQVCHAEADVITVQRDALLKSSSWKITKPYRVMAKIIKKIVKIIIPRKICKAAYILVHDGYGEFKRRYLAYFYSRKTEKLVSQNLILPDVGELNRQKNTLFNKKILFSIIVPLYNTPEQYLREMIESVQAQTYGNWELCMADGSDAEHSIVRDICEKYAKRDKRIRYQKLDNNEGISGNTNHCLEMAQGDYIALFDHDDWLHPSALYENMCVIDVEDADFIYSDENTFCKTPQDAYCPHYKPDFSPDTLRSYNYICHFSVFKRSLQNKVGLFRKEFDGSQDYDMILRLTEKAKKIVHIPKIIYYWRAHEASVASSISAKAYCIDAAKKALREHLQRVGFEGEVFDTAIPSVYKIKYRIIGKPLISIMIPNKDHIDDLSNCINSIFDKSTYSNFEIIVIENNSELTQTFEYYNEIEKNDKIHVVTWEGEFNYSAINNFGFTFANGEYILLLNNDMKVIAPDWLQEMLMFAQRKDVGAVGAKLYYPDDTIQHAGVIVGLGGVAGHSHKYFARTEPGYSYRLQLAQNLSAVTAACMMMSKEVFKKVGGLDESFKVAFNDVDLCMRIRKAGYLIVFTPFAELYHFESKSRGLEDTPEKEVRFRGEIQRFRMRWSAELEAGDPYYNPNLTLKTENFAVKYPRE